MPKSKAIILRPNYLPAKIEPHAKKSAIDVEHKVVDVNTSPPALLSWHPKEIKDTLKGADETVESFRKLSAEKKRRQR